ncbi:MAG: DUF1015 domain-containing protein [Oscillospiraceae bacterium]|jgi:hypothetical protein|nr:DUF1015 domain-containing protein [Oscillospiraceae bacterium]
MILKTTDILLPQGVDFTKWAVIACDQFSSDRAYWARVEASVGAAPSTLRLILPEAYLGDRADEDFAADIATNANAYLDGDVFDTLAGAMVYVEREISDGRVRRGLIAALDLEEYDWTAGSQTRVRASEQTVPERLPPRVTARRANPLELPHIMTLIDDKARAVIEPFAALRDTLPKLYDCPLTEGGGRVRGYLVSGELAERAAQAVEALPGDIKVIIGDGNHSLAAAKALWNEVRGALSPSEREKHPARFALVEVNNVYDDAIDFHAIHRVAFDTDVAAFTAGLESALAGGGGYTVRIVTASGESELATSYERIGGLIEAVQSYFDASGARIDYVHDDEAARALTTDAGTVAVMLPDMGKSDFFETVTERGVFPRKSFSIGHARDKRYYVECRRITKTR